jgi:hypothetical protein
VDSKKTIHFQKKLEPEWLLLMQAARWSGLTIEEVRRLLLKGKSLDKPNTYS